MKCIICRKEKDNMSDEHVIPDSLAGYYHIYNVCRNCNSELGSKVDGPLINHKLSELYRFCEEIKGKKGKIPNPFSGVFFSDQDSNVKAKINVGKDGKLDTLYHPIVTVNEQDGFVKSIEIEVDSKEEAAVDDILAKTLKRNGIPDAAVIRNEKRREIRAGGLGGQWKIDISKFKIGLLKIAYEFAVDSVEGYFDDVDAIKISEILTDADYDGVKAFVNIGSGLQHEVFAPFVDYLDLDSKKHYLVLMQHEVGLVCYIKLQNLFAVGVTLSKNQFLKTADGEGIFGVNDIEGRNFKKYSFSEVVNHCMGPLGTRFAYYFSNEMEARRGMAEVNVPNFRPEQEVGDKILLYKRDGTRYPFYVHDVLPQCRVQSKDDGVTKVELFEFNPGQEYFIKSVKSKSLYQVVAFEMSRTRIRKL